MTRTLLIALALMCEHVNAAPQVPVMATNGTRSAEVGSRLGSVEPATSANNPGATPAVAAPFTLASDMPPFKLDHPICPGGFTIAQRYDTRNSAGTIIKSVWVRKCTKGKIIYGGKV